MLLEFGDAFAPTAAEFRTWCIDAGFRRFEVIPLAGPVKRGGRLQVGPRDVMNRSGALADKRGVSDLAE
jgi:hypothetical protein